MHRNVLQTHIPLRGTVPRWEEMKLRKQTRDFHLVFLPFYMKVIICVLLEEKQKERDKLVNSILEKTQG